MATALDRIRDHQPGYGGWGQYVVTAFAARIATICGEGPALRDLVEAMDALRATLDSANSPVRTRPQWPAEAFAAWLSQNKTRLPSG